jgi:hypothetical protein
VTAPVSLFALANAIVTDRTTAWAQFDCYLITLFGGGTLAYTTAPFDILLANGVTYQSSSVRIDDSDNKSQAHFKVGLDTDTWQVLLRPRSEDPVTLAAFPDQINGVPWLQAASAGALDAAQFLVKRAYFSPMPTYPVAPTGALPVGARNLFAGVVASVDITTAAAVITANDFRELLTLQMPRNVYQVLCRHTLFDAGCGLNAADFVQSGTVQAGSTKSLIVTTLSAPGGSSGTFALGVITFTSGLNATFSRTVRNTSGTTTLNLFSPLPFPVSVGDGFDLYPGCDKRLPTCTAFGNLINNGAFPYIPAPETAA